MNKMKIYVKMIKEIIDRRLLQRVVLMIVLLLLAGMIEPFVTWVYKVIIDYISNFSKIDLQTIVLVIFTYEMFQCLLQIFNYVKEHFFLSINYQLSKNIMKSIHKKIKNIDMEEFEDRKVYDLLERINSKMADDVLDVLTTGFQIVTILITIVIYCVMLFDIRWYFPILIIISLVPSIALKQKKNKEKFYLAKELFPEERKKNYFLNIIFQRRYVKDIKLLNLEHFFLSKAQITNDKIIEKNRKLLVKYFLYELCLNILKYGILGSLIYITCLLAADNIVTVGSVMLLVNVFQLLIQNVENFVDLIKGFCDVSWLMEEWNEFKNLKEKKWGNKRNSTYTIQFENVKYKYPNSKENSLNGISVDIKSGEKIVIVGENGSGKSTFINLLMGMYPATEGKIKIDGIELKDIDKKCMDKIVCVFQNFVKYQATIKENITLGKGKLEKENIFAHSFGLDYFWQNRDTELGQLNEGGIELSGGQWQKLAICRGCVRQSKVLIMDEPTASLDPKSENELYENLVKICHNDKTLILISHRMSACRLCDRILTFSEGKIIEDGTFDELIEKKGKFYELYMAQKEYY